MLVDIFLYALILYSQNSSLQAWISKYKAPCFTAVKRTSEEMYFCKHLE